LLQLLAVQLHRPTCDLQPSVTAVGERVLDLLFGFEQSHVQAGVLVDGHGALASVWRRDQAQLAQLLLARKSLLLISWLNAGLFRQDPYLQQMNRIGFRLVGLAVADAAAGAHALAVAGTDDRAGAERVLVLERALENVSDDLH